MISLAFAALVLNAGVDRHPAVVALPEVARVETGRATVLIRGPLNPRQTARVVRTAKRVIKDVRARLGLQGGERKSYLDMCVFANAREYDAFAALTYPRPDFPRGGFYLPSKRLLLVNLASSLGNVRHELVHALIGDDFASVPAWLNEGMGSLYGTAIYRGGRYHFPTNYRLRHLKAAMKRGELPTFETLARSSYFDVYGDDVLTYYATGRYLMMYLDRRGRLGQFYRSMREAQRGSNAQLRVLRGAADYSAFVMWARRQRWPV